MISLDTVIKIRMLICIDMYWDMYRDTSHRGDNVSFHPYQKCLRYLSLIWVFKINDLRLQPSLLGANELKWIQHKAQNMVPFLLSLQAAEPGFSLTMLSRGAASKQCFVPNRALLTRYVKNENVLSKMVPRLWLLQCSMMMRWRKIDYSMASSS